MLHSDLSQLVNSDSGARFLTEENGVIANCFVTDEQNSILGLGFSREPLYMCLVVCVNSISYIRAEAQQKSRGKKCSVFLLQASRKEKLGSAALVYPGKFITYESKSLHSDTDVQTPRSHLTVMACAEPKTSRDSPSVPMERTGVFVSGAHGFSPDV